MNLELAKERADGVIITPHGEQRFRERVIAREGRLLVDETDTRSVRDYMRVYFLFVLSQGVHLEDIRNASLHRKLEATMLDHLSVENVRRAILIYRDRMFIFTQDYSVFITVLPVHNKLYKQLRLEQNRKNRVIMERRKRLGNENIVKSIKKAKKHATHPDRRRDTRSRDGYPAEEGEAL